MSVSQAQSSRSSRSPTALLVLGAPHSGGGAVARALEQCGAWSCDVRGVLDTMPDHLLARQRDEFLRTVSDCDARGTWVVEHSRLCTLLPVLRPHIAGAIYIHVFRSTLDSARLLQAEIGGDVSDALSVWEKYTASALQASDGLPRAFVSYEELVSNPGECVRKLLRDLEALGAHGLAMPPALEHANPTAGRRPERHDALGRVLEEKKAQVLVLKSEAKKASAEINILSQRVALLDAQVMEIYASSSWRVTKPLRFVSEAVQKAKLVLGRNSGHGRGAAAIRSLAGKYLGGVFPKARAAAALGTKGPSATLPGEDTFVIYRIIGNDLYPRHARGQAIENLRFILDHEPVLQGCEKRFVLNRIIDSGQEAEIIDLLERRGAQYLRLPFDPEEYAAVGFDTDILPEPDFLFSGRFEALGSAEQERVLGALYRHKNNYVMNNNGARNTALQDGRGRAKWILPWDGNCFLTQEAWERIRLDISRAQYNRYFVVPMARMLSNESLIHGGEAPKAVEEPQLIFRADAAEEFNPAFCYGRRPKVELLWRLGVKGPWDEYRDDAWDQQRLPVSPEANRVGRAGWVARLSSGMTTLETATDHAALHRGFARSGAILATLQQLDTQVAGVDSDQPISIRGDVLQQEVQAQDAEPVRSVVRSLLSVADEAALQGRHGAERGPRQELDDLLVFALAWSFTGSKGYVLHGSHMAGRLFVDPATKIEPMSGGLAGLHYHLDAIRVFENAGSVEGHEKEGVRAWLETHLEWLLTSHEGVEARKANDHRGTCHDLQVASIASFLDNQDLVYGALVRAQSRIRGQFAPDGRQLNELEGTATAHGCCFNFQKWVDLSELASRWGVDLWGYRSPEGACLQQGARWLLSHMGKPWPYAQAEAFDADRFQPIWFAAKEIVEDVPSRHQTRPSPYASKPIFPPQYGIRPFWSLASYGQPSKGP